MTISWIWFLPGLLLLLIPADRLLSSAVELRGFDCFQNMGRGKRFRPWWWVPVLWLDPFRGFGATFLLLRGLGLEAANYWAIVPKPAYSLLVGLILLGMLAQTLSWREEGVVLAPLGFAAGAVVALVPPLVAGMGLLSAVVTVFAFRQFYAFFAVGAVALTLFGFLFGAELYWCVLASALMGAPLFYAVAGGATMEIPMRDNTGGKTKPHRHRREITPQAGGDAT